MHAEQSATELCCKYGISLPAYYKWIKDLMEAGKKRLSGDELRESDFGSYKKSARTRL